MITCKYCSKTYYVNIFDKCDIEKQKSKRSKPYCDIRNRDMNICINCFKIMMKEISAENMYDKYDYNYNDTNMFLYNKYCVHF